MRLIRNIVVHTCGAASKGKAVHQTVETVRAFHISKGWNDIGYHKYIERDGEVRPGRNEEQPGAHATGFNEYTLGICCSGHGDIEPFNDAQMRSLVVQCVTWLRKHGLEPEDVIGHNETDEHGGPPVFKTCPGTRINMGEIRDLIRARMGPSA